MRAVVATVLILGLLTAGNFAGSGAGSPPAAELSPPAPLATTNYRGWVRALTNGSGIANVFLHVEWGGGGGGPSQANETATNSTGYYSLDVETGRISAIYVHEAYYAVFRNVTVAGAVHWENVTLASAPPRSATVKGKVTDVVTGAALANPTVIAFKSDWTYINITNGDAAGDYRVGVIPGGYSMQADVPGYTVQGPAKYLPVGAGGTLWYNISLMPLSGQNVTLKGYVRDSTTTNPIGGASVNTVDIFKQDNQTRTNGAGYYQIQIYPANTTLRFTADQHAPHMDRIKPTVSQTVYWYNVSLDPDTTRPVTDLTLSPGPNGPARKLTFSGWVNESYLQTATVNIGERVWENATVSGYSIRRQHYNTTDGLIAYDPVEMPLTTTAKDNASFSGEFNGTGRYGMLNGTLLDRTQIGTSYSESSFFKDRLIVIGLHTNSTDQNGNLSLGVFFMNGTLEFVFIAPGSQNRVLYPNDDPTARFGALNLTWYFRKVDMRVIWLSFTSDHNFTLPALTLVPLGVFPTGRYVAFAEMRDYGQNSGFDAHEFDLDTVAPDARAGNDVQIKDGDQVAFNGSASTDDIAVTNYTWTFNDGASNVTKYGAIPSHVFPVPGNVTVTLTAKDAADNAGTDTLVVGVAVRDRIVPVARAGNDITVGIGRNATLNGSASSDNIGIVDHAWMVSNGSANLTLSGAVVSVRFDVPGMFAATLEVRDAEGNLGNDTVNVTVVDDIAPVARAGSDLSVKAGTEVTLNSSGSSDNVGIVQHTWLVNNGTGPKFLNGSAVKVRYDTPGTFLAGVRVRDAAGNNDTDSLTVIVTAVADTTPPLADAGLDQTANQSGTVQFDGSGSSDNVAVAEYNWSFKEKGKDVYLSGEKPTRKFDAPDTYTVTLTVRDAAGNSDTDVMELVVRDTEPPVAKIVATPGTSVKTGDTVTFSSSTSTDNVGVNGPVTAWIVSRGGTPQVAAYSSVNASHKFSQAGTYTVSVEVKDTAGNIGKASVAVIVADPPTPEDPGGILLPLILLLLLAVVGAVLFFVMKRRKKEPEAGADATTAPPSGEEGDADVEAAGAGAVAEQAKDVEAGEERRAAAEKAAATVAMKKDAGVGSIESGLNYLFLGPDPRNAYEAFAKLVAAGKKGLVISSTLPAKLEKLYTITGAKAIWLTEKAGEGRVIPTRLDFEVTKAVNDFFKTNPGGVFLLDGVEYLISRNATDKVAQFVKKVSDTAGEGGGTFLVTLNPNAIPADPLGMLRKSFDKVTESK